MPSNKQGEGLAEAEEIKFIEGIWIQGYILLRQAPASQWK